MKHIGTFCKLLKQVIQWSIQYPRYLLGKFSQHAVQVFKAYNSAKFWFSYNNHVRHLVLFFVNCVSRARMFAPFLFIGPRFWPNIISWQMSTRCLRSRDVVGQWKVHTERALRTDERDGGRETVMQTNGYRMRPMFVGSNPCPVYWMDIYLL